MTLAFIAFPLALGLVGAVAITVILLEERERAKKLNGNGRPVRAYRSAGRGTAGGQERGGGTTDERREGKEWGYEVRKRRNPRKAEETDEHELLLRPLDTKRHESQSPRHVLANQSDFDLSSPEVARRPSLPSTTNEKTLIPIDEVTPTTSPIPPQASSSSSVESPPQLLSPPLVPTSPRSSSPIAPFSTESKDTSPTLCVPSPTPNDNKVISSTTTANSSTFSSPLLIDHSLSLEGSPAFSDLGIEGFSTRAGSEEGDGEMHSRRGRERSETVKSGSSVAGSGSGDGSWCQLSDEDDGDELDMKTGLSGGSDGKRGDLEAWEEIGRARSDQKGLGLGLSRMR
ncbi:uncharacterized protein JCM6883_002314 [Sporobolomyces salmoneus]|uniref:uncharacterized protein n=1 Tax=Sporobolomyces salmoneus TaxID=183962 RepID=UPI00318206EF